MRMERGLLMVSELATNLTIAKATSRRVTSYDSGYEYSPEHWFEVKQLVEASAAPAPKASLSLPKAS